MAELYPKEVNVNEAQIERLTRTFKRSYIQIFNEIETATDWGVYNRKLILAKIEAILTNLGVDVYEFIGKELPKYYKSGAADAVKQLHNIGAEVEIPEGFNLIHQEAIMALVNDTAKAFGESMTGVARSADLVLGKATRDLLTQQMAKGMIGGEALATVRKMIKATLREQGFAALTDKAGHKWTLDRYADMLFRTKAVEARNRGLANRAAENGYDLVQVSNNQTTHQECRVWEGKILSLTGKTPGYPTVAQAEEAGLFHPNCKHAINILAPTLAKQTRAYNPDTGKYGAPGESLSRTSE